MKKWLKENTFNIIIMLIFIILSLILIFFHENWRDEAQAWLIARDLSIPEIISQLKYEGHFLLWYLILIPFAKLGFPYITTNFISWFIVCISVWIILKKAPLKNWVKPFFIFSLPMIYMFSVISRCYCLIPLAISLMAWFYKERKTKPIRYILSIALLANTHIIMLGMVGITLIEFYIESFLNRKNASKDENKKILASLFLIAILLILTAFPLIGSLNQNQVIGESYSKGIIYAIKKLLILTNINLPILIFIAIVCFKKYFKFSIEFTISIIWQILIYFLIFEASYQKAGSIILIAMFYIWISNYDENKKDFSFLEICFYREIFIITMLLNITLSITFAITDIIKDFSYSYKAAEYINENTKENSIFITANLPSYVSSIIPYVTNNSKFYYLESEEYFTFTTWDKTAGTIADVETLTKRLESTFEGYDNIYYIYSTDKSGTNISDDELIDALLLEGKIYTVFTTSEEAFGSDEEYIIYKIEL